MYYSDTEATFWSVYFVTLLGLYILGAIANWKLFEKAGKPGWAALVPFYNTYVLHKITFQDKYWPFIFLMLVPYVNVVYSVYFLYNTGRAFGLSVGKSILYVMFGPLVSIWMGFSKNVHYVGQQKFIVN